MRTNTPSLNAATWIWMSVKFKISTLKLFKNKCFMLLKKIKFSTKNALFWYYGRQVEKDIAIFAINAFKMESFMQNIINFKLRPKLSFLDWHLKNYCHIWNAYKISKMLKCLYLGPKLLYLGIFGLEFENNIIIFEISTLEFV